MRNINVFIASSAELLHERMELVDLLTDIDDELEGQDIAFEPVLWEYMDSSMGIDRKEDEYLAELRKCEICIVLFWQTLGDYTVEELNVAYAEMLAGRLPRKVFIFFKEPMPQIQDKLVQFKNSISERYPQIPTYSFEKTDSLRSMVEKILKCSFSR